GGVNREWRAETPWSDSDGYAAYLCREVQERCRSVPGHATRRDGGRRRRSRRLALTHSSSFAMRSIAQAVSHRPFGLPKGPWVMFQSWRELLFAHWAVPMDVLRPLVPDALVLEECRGSAWVGL